MGTLHSRIHGTPLNYVAVSCLILLHLLTLTLISKVCSPLFISNCLSPIRFRCLRSHELNTLLSLHPTFRLLCLYLPRVLSLHNRSTKLILLLKLGRYLLALKLWIVTEVLILKCVEDLTVLHWLIQAKPVARGLLLLKNRLPWAFRRNTITVFVPRVIGDSKLGRISPNLTRRTNNSAIPIVLKKFSIKLSHRTLWLVGRLFRS